MGEQTALEGKVALIIGGGRGLGRLVALGCAERGASVAVVSRTASEAAQVAEAIRQLGPEAIAIAGDVTDPGRVGMIVEETIQKFGKVDILVNCQGESLIRPTTNTTVDEFERVIDVNLRSVFLTCQAVIREMVKQGSGHIINISSRVGVTGAASVAAYSAAKAGVIGLSKALALEFKPANIKVNVICPGPMDTTMRWKATPDYDPRKVIKPERVAEIVVLLATMSDTFIEDEIIPVSINS